MDLVYADTNVYLDWVQWRKGRGFLTHQGEEAEAFFNDVKAGKYRLLTSDHLEAQIKLHSTPSQFQQYKDYIAELDKKSLHSHIIAKPAERQQANITAKSCNSEYEDALHFELAKKGGAAILITQDEPHFKAFAGQMKICRPRLITMI
jgi:predicted nucleic acid-binding protein